MSVGHAHKIDTPLDSTISNLESQNASIRYLLMENSRLRSNEYARVAFDLFHPSDPLMKRLTKKESSDDDEIEILKRKQLAEISIAHSNLVKLGREFEEFLATSRVVDVTDGTAKDQVGPRLSPENQWKVQQLSLSRLLTRCRKLQDYPPLNSSSALKQGTTGIGRISFYKNLGGPFDLALGSRKELECLHRSILSH
jgi:hypothetical protein